ncbi:MAG TPA: RNA polymerase factor sigma-54 [Thermoanaerobaculia bacterium]|nr:RNA polymerase factor sigma-54 [Thermoanaerobaculia bacterium]
MALEQKLSLKLSQRLVMTPSLQQAIKLLQMNRLELEGVVTKELEENPILETSEEVEEREAEPETAEPEKDESSMDDIDIEAYFDNMLDGPDYPAPSGSYEQREAVPLENTLSREPDLYDHLLWQLRMMTLDDRIREIAELIVGNLDQDGFLVASIEELRLLGATPDEIDAYRAARGGAVGRSENGGDSRTAEVDERARPEAAEASAGTVEDLWPDAERRRAAEAWRDAPAHEAEAASAGDDVPGYAREEVEEALEVVRALDPPGIGYHELRDSLMRQLEVVGEEDTLAYRLISEEWHRVLKRQFAAIAKDLGLPLESLEGPVERIKQLDTRPGRRFGGERTQYVEPDVMVVRVGEEYVIQLNDDGLPRLRVSRAYRRMLREMRRERRQADAQQFIKEKMRSAVWLIKSLDQRQRTIYKVAESIVRQQREFLDRGIDRLRPMVLRDVADDIGMHESTVSRVVSNKYIHTPRGLFPMKFFFHSGIDRDYGEDISSLTVKRKIEKMIENEDAKKPLSDSALMKRLNQEGINIARRTVAKYRDELSIPSSTDRKKVF